MAEEEHPSVSLLFDKCLKIHDEIDKSDLPTNSDSLQVKIREGIDGLIKTTVLVSELGVFSRNEVLDELPTSSIKFLLLPVLLGSLSVKRTDFNRLEVLRLADIYYRDFVKRCKQYELTDAKLPNDQSEEDDSNEAESDRNNVPKASVKKGMPSPEELQIMVKQREEKIRRFKEKKAIGDLLVNLKKALDNPSYDEDTLRKYYITMVKKFIYESLEELDSLTMERTMLLEMEAMRKKGTLPDPQQIPKAKPLKPILITRDTIQNNVFGLGYPSLPSMTVEEFYDQRVRDGWFPDPTKSQNCHQDRTTFGLESEKNAEEQEEEAKEKAEEQDNPEKLERDREWDEWRDTHKRGWGNTYNRS
ncbi:immunoglobulin-binding protein 1-like [Homarus americanus]|uniref:immunoglobulin-binding protein 1-like n=1 Tax=Homarus americanus TaxID=6706 RepID=UPI001C44502A|nr:immunoglobulin-binding protein 1-like [Homarus americanus]